MQQIEILHKRNQLIYITYVTFFIIHYVAVLLGYFKFDYYYPYFALSFLIIVGTALIFKYNAKITQVCLLIGINSLIILLIWQSVYLFNIFWLVFFLLLITIYKSNRINIWMNILVFIEALILIYKHPYAKYSYSTSDIVFIAGFIFTMLLIVVLVQTFYIVNVWKKEEQKNIMRENELLSREAYLRLFFEHATDAISVFDLNNRIIEVNPAFEKLYGWSREESIGKTLPLVPPSKLEESTERYHRLLQGDSFRLIETLDMKKDGTTFDAQISLSPIYNTNKEIIALSLISRDISYIKENERLLVNAEKLKLAGEIAAGVAHEIRNPMTVISGFVQIMNADDQSPYKQYTEHIATEIERIDSIVSEFLVLARPQTDLNERFDILPVIDEVASFLQLEFTRRNIHLQLTKQTEQAIIAGNKNQIKQVLINIFKNAIEAISNNGEIKVVISEKEQVVSILIQDDGIGIPNHILKHIFEPFYTTKSKGTGLGMMITNKIIKDHKGDIKVNSKENIGTDVVIRLPLL